MSKFVLPSTLNFEEKPLYNQLERLEAVRSAYLVTIDYLSLPFLTLPFISLPFLTLPFISFPFFTFPYVSLPFLTFPLTFP